MYLTLAGGGREVDGGDHQDGDDDDQASHDSLLFPLSIPVENWCNF